MIVISFKNEFFTISLTALGRFRPSTASHQFLVNDWSTLKSSHSAVECDIASKGLWRSSKTPEIQQTLSNTYLESQGLYTLRDGWIKLHHSK